MNCFVYKISLELAPKLKNALIDRGFSLSTPPHTLFSGKKTGLSCTLYASGKLVVQGKEAADFVTFFIEPDLIGEVAMIDLSARGGSDEAGKGDFFGPLAVAAVYANEKQIASLSEWGVRDSKQMNDKTIVRLAMQIEKELPYHILVLQPKKYNELYATMGNLNTLLAWAHAASIESLAKKTGCQRIIVDQFANPAVLLKAAEKRHLTLEIVQRTKGEEDLVVAAASLLARKAFLESLARLETSYQCTLPKGASESVIRAGKSFVAKWGVEELPGVAKMHFKTALHFQI